VITRGAARAALAGCLAAACTDISDNATAALSIQFEPLASPSVVLGDSLRDTTGAIATPTVHAFNFSGDEILAPPVRFHSADPGVTVDSITGVVRGDSLRTTPARIVASIGELQAVQRVDVTLRPDAVAALDGVVTLQYSLLDSTLNVSSPLTVKVTHGVPPADSAVRSYVVSFAIVSGGAPDLATLVDGAGKASLVDTTDAGGAAGRAVRVRPVHLGSVIEDSVIVNATVKYRGTPVSGTPVRLVVHLRPRQ
jgi:hypothetical protein